MNDELEKLLNSIGLTGSEAKLYLTNLALGPTSAINLGKKIGVTRQRIYVLLAELENKGLIKKIAVGARQYYQTLDPVVLLDRAKNISQEIENSLPMLKSRQAAFGVLPLISVYENPIAMREWYRHYMTEAKAGEELLVWSTGKLHSWYNMDREFYDKYLKFSEHQGVKTKVLLPGTDSAAEYQKAVGQPSTEFKFMNGDWQSQAEKWIWRDQICFLSIDENATNMIVIQSEKLAKLERFNFMSIWIILSKQQDSH